MAKLQHKAWIISLSLLILSASPNRSMPLPPSRPAPSVVEAPQQIFVPLGAGETPYRDASALFDTLTQDFATDRDGTVYVATGDIPAMWLRDSSAQTLPCVRFATDHPRIAALVRGVIERNAQNVLTDPYANAFTSGHRIWEEKWEPDSLAYPITLAWVYWRQTGDPSIFTPRLRWAWDHTLTTYETEQHHAARSQYRSRFLANRGAGEDFTDTGMIWSGFRPSDDPVKYPFNIPQSMLVAVAMDELATMEREGFHDEVQAGRARHIADDVRAGIERYGKIWHPRYGWMYAYEVDGRGRYVLMDDANMPNLLSATFFGFLSANDPLYRDTRRFVLSDDNPYYYRGRYATGLGSSHSPTGWVWPLGLIAQGLTAQTPRETEEVLAELIATDGYAGLIHESFDPNDPKRFTRAEFGWANSMMAELLLRSVAGLPGQRFEPESPEDQMMPHVAETPTLASTEQQWRTRAAVRSALDDLSLLSGAPYAFRSF